MLRRGFLATLFTLPTLANREIQDGLTDVLAPEPFSSPPPSDYASSDDYEEWWTIWDKERDLLETKYRAYDTPEQNMDYRVRNKKSWSPAFKAHVQAQLKVDYYCNKDPWNFNDKQQLAYLIKNKLWK